jgi:hypothetical protein
MSHSQQDLRVRVVRAAEAALARQQYVSAIDVFCGMGLLASTNVDAWRKGRIDFLERMLQGSPGKISSSLSIFRDWALEKGLHPSEIEYARNTRAGTAPLQFTQAAHPEMEKIYRTHYLSAALSPVKRQQLETKLNRAPQPVVFEIVRDSAAGTRSSPGDADDQAHRGLIPRLSTGGTGGHRSTHCRAGKRPRRTD